MERFTVTVKGMYKHLMCSILQYHNIVLFSAENGALWCFAVGGDGSSCSDLQTTVQMGPYPNPPNAWSYEACATPAIGSAECPAA